MAILALGHHSFSQPFSFKKSAEGIEINEDNKPVFFFQTKPKSVDGKYERAGYIHPLYDLDGNVLTDDMPEDHPYHRGIFWAWHQIIVDNKNVADGWTSDHIAFVPGKMQATKSGKNMILSSQLVWQIKDSVKGDYNIVNEITRINIYRKSDNYRIIDFSILLKPVVPNLKLGGSDDPKGYGGFCLRLKLPDNLKFISRGNNIEPQETAVMSGPWMDFNTNGSGVTVFGYKSVTDNKYPWILRKKTSMQNVPNPGREPVSIPKDGLQLNYRVVIHNGKINNDDIEKLYVEYQTEKKTF
jgi:hypothetical protein